MGRHINQGVSCKLYYKKKSQIGRNANKAENAWNMHMNTNQQKKPRKIPVHYMNDGAGNWINNA